MPKKELRPIRIEGDIAFVTLTKGYEAIVDAADIHLVEGFNWFADVKGRTVYACRNHKSPRRGLVYMHRAIAQTPEGMDTDHRDLNGLNNRRSNLRTATKSQNQHNVTAQVNNTSGYKGVSFRRDRGVWRANISHNRKTLFLGHFSKPELAHAAFCEAAAKLHQDFARS